MVEGMIKIISIDPDKCTSCRACELACSMKQTGEFNPAKSRINAIINAEEAFYLPMTCLQCEDPYCARICPSNAITRDEATGIVSVEEKKCSGCKMCMLACPCGVLRYSECKVVKCDLCGGDPECVRFCAPGALKFVEAEKAFVYKEKAASKKLMEIYKGVRL